MNATEKAIKESVEKHEGEWSFSENLIYNTCVEAVGKMNFCEIKERDVNGPIKTFLHNWGIMGRVLAKQNNWERRLASAIRKKCEMFDKFRNLHLEGHDIGGLESEIEGCYADIKGVVKQTSASKVLHLLSYNFFPLWDTNIRKEVNRNFEKTINEKPKGYFNFMLANQRILERYDKTISKLSERYKRPKLRILDVFLHSVTRSEGGLNSFSLF